MLSIVISSQKISWSTPRIISWKYAISGFQDRFHRRFRVQGSRAGRWQTMSQRGGIDLRSCYWVIQNMDQKSICGPSVALWASSVMVSPYFLETLKSISSTWFKKSSVHLPKNSKRASGRILDSTAWSSQIFQSQRLWRKGTSVVYPRKL